jgi:thioredoxin reductase (NADPH)
MSALPPLSTPDPRTQAFPVLPQALIDRIRPFGKERKVERGEILFEPGQSDTHFFVVLSGFMEIVQQTLDGERKIVNHGPGEFTGEITMISGQLSLVRGRVTEPGVFLELDPTALRELVAKDAEVSEILMRAFILRRVELIRGGLGNAILLGSRHSPKTLDLREFLGRNNYPFTYVDLDADQASQELLDRFHVKAADIPVAICHGQFVLRNPSIQELAQCLGFNPKLENDHVHDVVILGAGPAGLAAAVYAASEGLEVLVIETRAPGGQAGCSSKIENYLGFPTGVSGQELASRALTQAQKFGAAMMVARTAVRLDCDERPYRVTLDSGESIATRAIVIATGAQYNRPALPNIARFEGEGVYYGATHIEAQLCGAEEVAVVGGGNSAGQAAVFLSQTARKVHMLVRGAELSSTMSRYLIQRLAENAHVELHYSTEIVALDGEDHLRKITWRNKATGETSTHEIQHLFIMTGASPKTEWLKGCVALDHKGFILTGRDLDGLPKGNGIKWPLERPPLMLETSLPGVFAVGDVRSGNVKRVASAVGEGAISIHLVHRALAEI